MLRIDRAQKTLTLLEQRRIPESGLKERDDIQAMIRQSADAFFSEMGEDLLLVGEEVRPTDFVEDRIDLLAIDQQGAAVVIELKRGSHKLHLLQALAYVSMVSKWEAGRFIAERSRFTNTPSEDAEEEIEQFLLEDINTVNDAQRVILLAGDFDFEVLVTAEWLNERYGVDIRCYRIALSAEGETEFLTCTCIYPPPELTQHAIRRVRNGGSHPLKWADWDAALAPIENPAIVNFFGQELAAGRDSNLRKRALRYRLGGKRRLAILAREKAAYVWQTGRFENDVQFWTTKLGVEARVEPVKSGQCLRFFLSTDKNFLKFSEALQKELAEVEFLDVGDLSETEDE